MTDKTTSNDPTAARMNDLAKRLADTRGEAVEQIVALGWPKDVVNDWRWYEDEERKPDPPKVNSRKQKERDRAFKIRESIIEIDFALSCMNHYAADFGSISGEPDAIIEALEACINAIAAFYSPDAEIGKQQRRNGKAERTEKAYILARRAIHQRWTAEDGRLMAEKPHLSASGRARLIAEKHSSQQGEQPVTVQTVYKAIRRFKKKLVSQA